MTSAPWPAPMPCPGHGVSAAGSVRGGAPLRGAGHPGYPLRPGLAFPGTRRGSTRVAGGALRYYRRAHRADTGGAVGGWPDTPPARPERSVAFRVTGRVVATQPALQGKRPENQRGVGAAKPKGITHGRAYRSLTRDIGHIIQIAGRVRVFIINGRRHKSVA